MFGEANGGKIYTFYRSLKTAKQTKQDRFMTLTERRTKSIDYLVKNYGEHYLLAGIDLFDKKSESGELTVNTIPYFNKVVENLANSPQRVEEKRIIHPKLKRVDPIMTDIVCDDYEPHYSLKFKWLYYCKSCETNFSAWDDKCPGCNLEIDWDKIKEE
jgi:hypothetical protein